MDWALNRLSRTETLPDSKSPRQKGGGVLAIAISRRKSGLRGPLGYEIAYYQP